MIAVVRRPRACTIDVGCGMLVDQAKQRAMRIAMHVFARGQQPGVECRRAMTDRADTIGSFTTQLL